MNKAPIEITISPNGVITVLDPDILLLTGLEVKIQRTSEIVFLPVQKRFIIRLLRSWIADHITEKHFEALALAAPEGFDVDYWRGIAQPIKDIHTGVSYLSFPSYALAVGFERWVIPVLRGIDGQDQY